VTTGLISQWERGEEHPQGTSLKLLAPVAKNGLDAVA
jgi:putative transcriptional regulator